MKTIWLVILLATCAAAAQDNIYENRNQIDYQLKVRGLKGIVRDAAGSVIPDAKVLIFSDDKEHSLLASAVTNGEGRFAVERLKWKRVRLVVKYGPFCSANAIVNRSGRSRSLVVIMRPAAIEECSYIETR